MSSLILLWSHWKLRKWILLVGSRVAWKNYTRVNAFAGIISFMVYGSAGSAVCDHKRCWYTATSSSLFISLHTDGIDIEYTIHKNEYKSVEHIFQKDNLRSGKNETSSMAISIFLNSTILRYNIYIYIFVCQQSPPVSHKTTWSHMSNAQSLSMQSKKKTSPQPQQFKLFPCW